MNMNRHFKIKIVLFLVVIILAGCKASPVQTLVATVDKLTEPVSVNVSPAQDFDEVVTSDEITEVTVTVSNNSSDEIRDLKYDFDSSENIYDFKPTLDGLVESPGFGGTCKTTLASKTSCTFKLDLIPRKQGKFTIAGTISYLNRVEPQTKPLTVSLISGEPASIVFTNDKSVYNFGVIEQTDLIKRYEEIEVKNVGGLTARSLVVDVYNDNIDGAYKLESHNCPKSLKPREICKARISYQPTNNNYTDPEDIFTGKLKFGYIKDPLDNKASTIAYFSLTSAAIEAKFKTNFPQSDFGTITTGNKEYRLVKLTNMGYREGILKELIIKKSDDSVAATCKKAASGNILDCNKTLAQLPFIIEDTNSCFDNIVVDYTSTTGSANCVFKITYWPSVTYLKGTQSTYNFNNSSVSFTYDSRWKGNVNMVTKDNIFNFLANFSAKAQLAITKIEFNTNTIPFVDLSGTAVANLGRIAKIAPAYTSVFYPTKIYYKNIGEVDASFLKLNDGKVVPTSLIDVNEFTPGASLPRDFNNYYKEIKQTDCLTVAADGECTVSFNVSPFKAANQAIEDGFMYDNILDPFNKFKSFDLLYADGSSFNDDGTVVESRNVKVNLISTLIAKGKLSVSPIALNFGSPTPIVVGDKAVKNIILKNIGTGKIAALQYNIAKTLEIPAAASGIPAYPYRLLTFASQGESLPPGADFDCLDLMRPGAASFPFTVDASKILDEGKACAFRIEAKLPLNSATLTNSITPEFKRNWSLGVSNTLDAWRRAVPTLPIINPKFFYWDGDDNSLNDPLSFPTFGYKAASVENVAINSAWKTPANLFIAQVEPMASAVVSQPEIIYPVVNESFPTTTMLPTFTVPLKQFTYVEFFPSATISTSLLKKGDILNYLASFPSYLHPTAQTIMLGSIKKSQDLFTTISFDNSGTETPTEAQIIDFGGDAGFTLTKFSTLTGANVFNKITSGINTFNVTFKFNQATAGTYQRCYDIVYKGSLGNKSHRFCLTAVALDAAPNLAIDYKNSEVTWNTTTSSFDITYDASWNTFKSPLNKISTCDQYIFSGCTNPNLANEILNFSTVYSTAASCIAGKNCQFDQKVIRFTNSGNATLTDFRLDLTTLPVTNYVSSTMLYKMNDTQCNNPANYFVDIQNKIAVCSRDITACNNLVPGASCIIPVIYTPTASATLNSSLMLGVAYRYHDNRSGTYPNASSYVNQFIPIRYEALASANPVAKGYMRKGIDPGVNDAGFPVTVTSVKTITASEVVNNWSDPLNPNSSEANSYPIRIGTYAEGFNATTTVVEPSFVLDTVPKKMIIYINLENPSSTRISFLKANPSPSTAWTQVYPEWNTTTSSFKTYNAKYGAAKSVVFASEGCFYGEVKNDNGVASNMKGFNSTTTATNSRCQLKVEFSGDITYPTCNVSTKAKTVQMGGDIGSCNPYVYRIPIWSYKRSTEGLFKFHIKDFIEPNRSNYTGGFTNVSSSYTISKN